MDQLMRIYKEMLNCEKNKAEDSEHEHEAKWKGNAGLRGTAWKQGEEEKWRESEGSEMCKAKCSMQ